MFIWSAVSRSDKEVTLKFERRHFLKSVAFQSAILLSSRTGQSETVERKEVPRKTLSILQGMTDEESTEISVLFNKSQNLKFVVTDDDGNLVQTAKILEASRPNHPSQMVHLGVWGLSIGKAYTLSCLDALTGSLVDRREFRALDMRQPNLRMALCSCMNDARHEPTIWRSLLAQAPQVVLFLGDSVYADDGISSGVATPNHLWKRFCEARQILEIYHLPKLIPTLATWDDHDFGMDDSNSVDYPYVSESQQNFQWFFPQSGQLTRKLEQGPGISRALYLSGHLVFLMDDRSFRRPPDEKSPVGHWGHEQEEWLFEKIKAHQGPVIICNGSQLFPQMVFKESFSGDHGAQFVRIIQRLREAGNPTFFASGDVHFSEVSKIESSFLGYSTYEITSSSIHSATFPGILEIVNNKRRVAGTSKRNFVMIESRAAIDGARSKATSIGQNGQKLFERDISVYF